MLFYGMDLFGSCLCLDLGVHANFLNIDSLVTQPEDGLQILT